MGTLKETKTVAIELTQPIPSTNPSELKSKEDEEETFSIEEPEIIIPEPILKKNPRRFNSGKELYDFLDEIHINIKKIKSESSNKTH